MQNEEDLKEKTKNFKLQIYLVLFLFYLLIVIALISLFNSELERYSKEDFEKDTLDITNNLQKNLESYADVLYSARSLFSIPREVNLLDWNIYTDSMKIFERYPGINGTAFIKHLHAGEIEEFNTNINTEYKFELLENEKIEVFPEGDRENYFVVNYALYKGEVRQSNVVGYDLGSSNERLTAMQIAEDTNLPTSTAPVKLIFDQEEGRGYVVFLPIYNFHDIENLDKYGRIGFVTVTFKPNGVIQNFIGEFLSKNNVELVVKDVLANEVIFGANELPENRHNQNKLKFEFAGRTLEYEFFTTKRYKTYARGKFVVFMIVSGFASMFIMSCILANKTILKKNNS